MKASDVAEIMSQPEPEKPSPAITVSELIARCPKLNDPVIDGILRESEIANMIASSKVGKSWMLLSLLLSVATGRSWLGRFRTTAGPVLLIDNELHENTLAKRFQATANAMSIDLDAFGADLYVRAVRGDIRSLEGMADYFDSIQPGQFRLIALDAFYRFLPAGTDENDNGQMTQLYNLLDRHAQRLKCAFVLIHHASKGSQADKVITDVGSGAGAMSRASDTHLVLRPHAVDGCVVMDAAVRSFPPLAPICLRWTYPTWSIDESLDPTQLRRPPRRNAAPKEPKEKPEPISVPEFVERFVKKDPQSKKVIMQRAKMDKSTGLSAAAAEGMLKLAVADGLVFEWSSKAANKPSRYATVQARLIDDAG
ncbi:MAG: hypothetical protein AMXMBFR13_34610 [Phycisphaerae bacterium]